jgi:hypothetical protein
MSRRPENKTPEYYFACADDAAENHRYSSAVTYAAKGLALFPSVGMKAPQMRLAAEYRQKRAEWMQDAAKSAENLLKTDMANDPLPDASIGLAFPEEFKIWKSATPDIRLDILNRSATPAGTYKRLAVCMATIRADMIAEAERARKIAEGENERRKPSEKGPRVPSQKEVFRALDARKAATKRRIGIA